MGSSVLHTCQGFLTYSQHRGQWEDPHSVRRTAALTWPCGFLTAVLCPPHAPNPREAGVLKFSVLQVSGCVNQSPWASRILLEGAQESADWMSQANSTTAN